MATPDLIERLRNRADLCKSVNDQRIMREAADALARQGAGLVALERPAPENFANLCRELGLTDTCHRVIWTWLCDNRFGQRPGSADAVVKGQQVRHWVVGHDGSWGDLKYVEIEDGSGDYIVCDVCGDVDESGQSTITDGTRQRAQLIVDAVNSYRAIDAHLSAPEVSGTDPMRLAEKAVEKIIFNMTDRRGLAHAWDYIDPDIQAELKSSWATIIHNVVTLSERGA